MTPPGGAPTVSQADVLRAFRVSEQPCAPRTASEVAETLECAASETRIALADLTEGGMLGSKTIDGTRVWWLADGESMDQKGFGYNQRFIDQLLETVPVSISIITSDGEFLRANSRALERLGIEESELDEYSADSWDLYDEEGELIPAEEVPWMNSIEDNGSVQEYQCQVDLPSIGRRWLSVNAAPIEGETDHLILAIDDVTQERDRERQLRRERNQTEELLRTAPIAISVQGTDGDTVLANQRAQELLGLSEQEIIDEPDDTSEWRIYDASNTEITPAETPSARVHATEEPVFDEEIAIERPDGETQWFSVSSAPVFDADGELDRVITTGEDITELKRREAELERRKRELETELSEILGRISDAFYALDDEWRFTHVNDRAEDLLQRSREELIDEHFLDVFPEAVGTEVWERFQGARETNEPVSFEYEYEELDTWIEVNAYPSETGLSVYFQDITDRKEHEQELERYRTIVEAVDDGIYTVDSDGHFTMVNEAYVELTGYPREELLGSHVSMVVDDDVVEEASESERDLVSGEAERTVLEADMKRADGGTVPAEATFAIFPSEDEYERIGVVRDITERKEQQRALEESERRYRTLVEHFPDGAVGLFDEDLRYTAVGGQLLDQVGISPEDRIGKHISEAYPEEIVEKYGQYFDAVFDGEANEFESEFHGLHLYNQTLPVRDADGTIIAGMLVAQDISERMEYRQQLEETIEQLQESNERLEQFAYVASHDLQEPLRMITSYLDLLDDRYRNELDDQARECIDYAVKGANRMRTMVKDLLTYSRLDTDADPPESTDPEEIVDDVLDNLQVQIEESQADITVGELPIVEADQNQLEQVFQNLISNAIKYRGDDSPRIEIRATRQDGTCRFEIADNGIGIDPAYSDQIFEVFKRLHNDEEYPGTGIGLALCKKIVDRHGGDIWVESELGDGSTFYFTIPLND